jgi:hypothetical protein
MVAKVVGESGDYYRRYSFPLNEKIYFDSIKCLFKNDQLEVTAKIKPLISNQPTNNHAKKPSS